MAVKAVNHNKAGNVITPGQYDRGSQLVFKVWEIFLPSIHNSIRLAMPFSALPDPLNVNVWPTT